MTGTLAKSLVHFPLAIKPAAGRLHEPAAWFLPGDDPARWMAEMSRWNVSLIDARLYLLPTGINDPQPCGVLVIVKDGMPQVATALAYAAIGDRLFFPADAALDPEVSADELAGKLLWDVQVLHPAAGLVGFSRQDAIGVEELISPPERKSADWSHAHPGLPPRPRLISVVGQAPPSLEQIMDMGRDDIGSQANEEVPISPDESPVLDAIGNAVNSGLRPVASALLRLAKFGSPLIPRLPQGKNAGKKQRPPREPGPVQRWLMQKIKSMGEASQNLRNREINRLLELLKNDPDMGLQYALPLQTLSTRGLAAPSNSLGRRAVDFNLSNLFGGNQPGDSWAVPPDLQKDLREKYREAANRELNLGRFSRAAYIFAHLLGDYTAAADALKRSRQFREAAVIYKDKLNNPRAAADCMVEGGLLQEAIPLYESLHQYEIAGDLHARLGQTDDATASWRKAVGLLHSQQNVLAAAKIVEQKLLEPDDALEMLAATWPDADSAGVCLRAWFSLAGDLGYHEAAHRRLGSICEGPIRPSRIVLVVEHLSGISGSYPNPGVRALAADSARVLAGNRIPDANEIEKQTLVRHVVGLVRADRLLARDGDRFLSKPKPKPAQLLIPFKSTGPGHARSFRLPGDFDWRCVAAIPAGFLVFGTRGLGGTVVGGTWDGRMQSVFVNQFNTSDPCLLLAPAHGERAALVWFGQSSQRRLAPFTLPLLDAFQDAITVDTATYVDDNIVGACRAETGTTWLLHHEGAGRVSLKAHGSGGKLLASHVVHAPFDVANPVIPVPMAARRNTVFIALGSQLQLMQEDKKPINIELGSTIRSLTPSPAHTLVRMIAGFDDGCALIAQTGEYRLLAQGVPDPVSTFTPDGSLVVAGQGKGHIYRRQGAEVVSYSAFEPISQRRPLAVLPAVHGEFAIFDTAGGVDVWRLGL